MNRRPVELVKRTVTPDDMWRDSTYERADGSTFRVAVKPKVGLPSGRRVWDEAAEAEMVMRLADLGRPDTERTD